MSRERYRHLHGRTFGRRCGSCDTATTERIPIFTVMESLMNSRSYGVQDVANRIFSQISAELRARLTSAAFSHAESLCPQTMPIAALMREAHAELNRWHGPS